MGDTLIKNPVTPAEFKALVPTGSETLCDTVPKTLIKLPHLFAKWYAWAFTESGEVSSSFRAQFPTSATGDGTGGTVVGSIPAAPVMKETLDQDWGLKVSWAASSGATYYQVKRGDTNDVGAAQLVGPEQILKAEYQDKQILSGVGYYYWARACNTVGYSAWSATPASGTHTAWLGFTQLSAGTTSVITADQDGQILTIYAIGGGGGGGTAVVVPNAYGTGYITVKGGGGGGGGCLMFKYKVATGQKVKITGGNGGLKNNLTYCTKSSGDMTVTILSAQDEVIIKAVAGGGWDGCGAPDLKAAAQRNPGGGGEAGICTIETGYDLLYTDPGTQALQWNGAYPVEAGQPFSRTSYGFGGQSWKDATLGINSDGSLGRGGGGGTWDENQTRLEPEGGTDGAVYHKIAP